MLADVGFLVRSADAMPVTVTLRRSDDDLLLVHADSSEERVPFRHLHRALDENQQLHLGRRGKRGWRLNTSGAVADLLREHVPRHGRRMGWGAARLWHGLFFVATLLVVELVKLPADWLAPLVPQSLEGRLAPADVRGRYGSYCQSPAGERAIRRLIRRLDPEVEKRVRIEVLNEGAFLLSAVPGDRLIIYLPFLNEIGTDELAALIAHEVAHLQKRDAVAATLRSDGTLGALLRILVRTSNDDDWSLDFSPDEEAAADFKALDMLLRAGISPLPGAALFDRMEQARQKNEPFGKEQYYLHYGRHGGRGLTWRDYPQSGALLRTGSAMTPAEQDALFNYCFDGKAPPRNPYP